jgi:hypothetical protein
MIALALFVADKRAVAMIYYFFAIALEFGAVAALFGAQMCTF